MVLLCLPIMLVHSEVQPTNWTTACHHYCAIGGSESYRVARFHHPSLLFSLPTSRLCLRGGNLSLHHALVPFAGTLNLHHLTTTWNFCFLGDHLSLDVAHIWISTSCQFLGQGGREGADQQCHPLQARLQGVSVPHWELSLPRLLRAQFHGGVEVHIGGAFFWAAFFASLLPSRHPDCSTWSNVKQVRSS